MLTYITFTAGNTLLIALKVKGLEDASVLVAEVERNINHDQSTAKRS